MLQIYGLLTAWGKTIPNELLSWNIIPYLSTSWNNSAFATKVCLLIFKPIAQSSACELLSH